MNYPQCGCPCSGHLSSHRSEYFRGNSSLQLAHLPFYCPHLRRFKLCASAGLVLLIIRKLPSERSESGVIGKSSPTIRRKSRENRIIGMWLLPVFQKPLRAVSRKLLNLYGGKWEVRVWRPGVYRSPGPQSALLAPGLNVSKCFSVWSPRDANRSLEQTDRLSATLDAATNSLAVSKGTRCFSMIAQRCFPHCSQCRVRPRFRTSGRHALKKNYRVLTLESETWGYAATWTNSNRKGRMRLAGSVHCGPPQPFRDPRPESRIPAFFVRPPAACSALHLSIGQRYWLRADFWVDNSELVHAHFARTNCVPKTRRSKSGKFLDLLGARLGPWNEFALAQIVEGMSTPELTRGLDGPQDGRSITVGGKVVAIDYGGILKLVAGQRSVRAQVFRPKEVSAPQQGRCGEAWAAGRQGARRHRSQCRTHPPRSSPGC